tara:strand:+ start:1236 stop:1349 length:114 start_codon:yes stop_codon:yes gene_type:complete
MQAEFETPDNVSDKQLIGNKRPSSLALMTKKAKNDAE